MGIVLEINVDGSARRVDLPGPSSVVVNNSTSGPVVVNNEASQQIMVASQPTPAPVVIDNQLPQSRSIEVMAGLPGVQNLFVGPTPPSNPQENWIWIEV